MPDTNAIEDARDLIRRRLDDLDEERRRLERAVAELGGKAKRSGGRPRASASTRAPQATPASQRRSRRRPGGSRADQAVTLIEKNPGIGAGAIAKAMKIKPAYLYTVLGDLAKEGAVKKDGRRYHPSGG